MKTSDAQSGARLLLLGLALLVSCSPVATTSSTPEPQGPPAQAPGERTDARRSEASDSGKPEQTRRAVEPRFPRSETAWMGVQLRATEREQAGVEVVRVFSGSPAEKAGLLAGDTIVSLGGTPVLQPTDVADWVVDAGPGGRHPVGILRAGEQRMFRVRLEGRPDFEDRLRLELVGRPAPEIAGVATFQGEASSLAELSGQVVVLEFWASYCGVCRILAPRLDSWHRTYQPQGAQVVGITVDSPQLGLQVARRTGMSYTLATDPGAEVTEKYMATQIPVVIVIDRDGIVRDAMVGYSERRLSETRALIEKLVAEDT